MPGIPVQSDKYSLTVGAGGPILLQDSYLIEQMANFNRERIKERQPHAKGSGAFGRFEVTGDVSAYTRAAFLQPGTETRMVARFSTVAGERGSPDMWRDLRGFALKFYTSEGNYDMVGNDTPVFFMRDPIHFQNFIRSQKRLAKVNLRSNDMQWDFWTLLPETAHQVIWLMGDRGFPRTFRHMNGYSSHTYMWVNAEGVQSWVKYHFISDQGIEFLTQAEGDRLAGTDPDFHTRDLYEAIERGEHPSWTLKVQIMPYEDARTYRFNPFDITKVWPHGDYPLTEVGRFTLDRNPADYHTEIEQLAVAPAQPGARHRAEPGPAAARPAVLLPRRAPGQARRELHADPGQRPGRAGARLQQGRDRAGPQRHRPGVLPELQGRPAGRRRAQPAADLVLRRRDGAHRLRAARRGRRLGPGRHAGPRGDGRRRRDRLVSNIVGALLAGVTEPVLQRAFWYLGNVDKDLGDRVEKGVRAGQ